MVRAEIEVELRRLFAHRVELRAHFCGVVLDVAAALRLHFGDKFGLLKVGVGQEYGGEELVLEGNPFQRFFQFFLIVFGGGQVVGVIAGYLVSQFGKAVLVGIAFFNLTGTL